MRKLKLLLSHSYENVPFYRWKFDRAKIKPADINRIEDLHKIPLTTRQELQKLPAEMTTARNIDLGQCEKNTTSGTTGMPLNLVLDRKAVEYDKGLWIRSYERNGLRKQDRMAVIKHPGYFGKKHWFQNLGIMRRKFISALDDTENQIRILEKYHPQAIKGYASALWQIARALEHRSHHIKPRVVFSGGELLSPHARRLISSSFETEVLDTYGTSEFSLVAWECKAHSGYHINADSVIMELLDEQWEQVAEGERGAVVCTGLHNYAMPLIRFKDDDIAVPLAEECSCGVKLPMLKNVEGRENNLLVTLDGHFISPWRFFPFPFDDYSGITQFRIIQDRNDRVLFQMALEETFDRSRLDKAKQRIKDLFGEGMTVDFQMVDKFEKDKSGKIIAISRTF